MYTSGTIQRLILDLVRATIVVVSLNVIFLLTIFATNALVDHRALSDRLRLAVTQGAIDDRDYPADLALYVDRYTDCLALSLNLRGNPDRTATQLIRDSEIAKLEGIGACKTLILMLSDQSSVGTMEYGRYWHGYQVISKPFIRFGDIRNLRYIIACLVIAAVFFYSMVLARDLAAREYTGLLGIWFAFSYLLLTDGADLSDVFTQALSLLVIFLAPLVAYRLAKLNYSPLLIAAVCGALNAFFDLLFNPPLGLSTLIVALVLARSDEKPAPLNNVGLVAIVILGWATGFFGTYLCRFAVAIMLSDNPFATIQQIAQAGLFRIAGMEEKIKPALFWATIVNFGYPMIRPSFAVFVVLTTALAIFLWLKNYRPALQSLSLVLLVPAAVSAAWFEIFRNHSQHHHFFTYRSASFSLVCIAAVAIFSLRRTEPRKRIVG